MSQFTPQGNLLFGTTDEQGNFVFDPEGADGAAKVFESPFAQQARQRSEGIANTLLGQATSQARGLQQGQLPTAADLGGIRDRGEQAFFDRATALLNPQLERQENTLRQSLANRGQPISRGTAGGTEFDLFNEGRNRTFQDLASQAVFAGDQLAGSELARASGLRQQQFNELAALLSGQQQTGGFGGQQNFQLPNPAEAARAAQASQLAAFNAQSQNAAANTSGTFGLLGALGAAGIGLLCWVAREAYGVDDPKWLMVRHWMLTQAPEPILRLYITHGPAIAEWMRDKPEAKAEMRKIMDGIIGEAA